ncbi:cobalamin-binding protein [Nitrosopumilus sp. S4]
MPSATELLYEFGVEENLFGVTHECKYPQGAKSKPIVINSVINSEKLSSDEIDKITCELLNSGKNIFVLNKENLKEADPDLIITQETCEVCAAYTNQVQESISILNRKPKLHSMDPHNIQEILNSVIDLGEILEKQSRAKEIVDSLEKRIRNIKKENITTHPKVLAIEWIEPFFTAGHWVPEMIHVAGGVNLISKTGEHSRRLSFQEISESDPDIIILMPCGFDVKRTVSEYENSLKNNKRWNSLKAVKKNQVYAVDANSFFSKPSIRTITGLEILAKIIHPSKFENLSIPNDSFMHISR